MTGAGKGPSGPPVVIRLRLLPAGGPTPRALGLSFAAHAVVIALLALLARPRPRDLPPFMTVSLTADAPSSRVSAPQRRTVPPPRPRGPLVTTPERVPAPPASEARGIEPPKPKPPKPPKPLPREAPAEVAPPPLPPPSPDAASGPPGPEQGDAPEGSDLRASAEGGGPVLDEYLGRLVARVSQSWSKPRAGLPSRSAIVLFEMGRDGRILSQELEQSSGHAGYDLAAQRALELAQPLPPLPPAHRSPRLKVHFEFIP